MATKKQNSTISPLDVAGFFLKLSGEQGITNLKLNKLVYLAHGYFWGNREKALITNGEEPEAWRHGPVYRSIYNRFGQFQADPVPSYLHKSAMLRPGSFDDDATEFIELVWNTYKDKNAWTLVRMLHEKGSPWDTVWNTFGGKDSNGTKIPDWLTMAYYIEKVKKLKKREQNQEEVQAA